MQKHLYRVLSGIIALTATSVLCLFDSGCANRPPSKWEQSHFDISTSSVPVLVLQTNVVPVTVFQTNTVPITVTNVQGVTMLSIQTNTVPVTVYQTNVATVWTTNESYGFSPGAGARDIVNATRAAGSIVPVPGLGEIAGAGAMLFFTVWGWLRSSKNYRTAANTAQVVETMREFIKSLPNGGKMDEQLTAFMTTHQAQAGVLQEMARLLEKEVDNPAAKEAARQVVNFISATTANKS